MPIENKGIEYTESDIRDAIRNILHPYVPDSIPRGDVYSYVKNAAIQSFINEDDGTWSHGIVRQALMDLNTYGYFKYKNFKE